ncbi:MAG: acyl-CoA reductase, partial [Bacteroidetes bacterium]|nr:acyl-CoA reductase [Bacteroidota bacterium]
MEAEFFTALGRHFAAYKTDARWQQVIKEAGIRNPWFSRDQVEFCLETWAEALQEAAVASWLQHLKPTTQAKIVGILMAGNIPLVGLHDLLCVLASGHHALVKLSSDDQVLMREVMRFAREYGLPTGQIMEETEHLKGVEAAIATGSNNSARYFKQYFGHLPHIIRKNRNSVALISLNEPESTLRALPDDLFRYYGLGCRNVTHLFLP